jgi:hypothetical protein
VIHNQIDQEAQSGATAQLSPDQLVDASRRNMVRTSALINHYLHELEKCAKADAKMRAIDDDILELSLDDQVIRQNRITLQRQIPTEVAWQ